MVWHQISFTRVSGQGGNYGWQAINISPDLSQEAVTAFTRFQNANINPPQFDKEDEQEQFVLDLQSENNSVFYTGLKYNISADDRGRSNMFANAFVFDINEFSHQPISVLSIQDSNFNFSIEDSPRMPEALTRYKALSLKEYAESIGLTEERYTALMQCVYQILSAKTNNTLHVVCDCAPQTIRNYMCCVYLALPYEFRKKISFSTYELPNGLPRTIVFERHKRDDGVYYYDASSGENNILSDVVLRKLSRYDYISIVPRNLSSGQAIEDYFGALEEKLAQFDCAHTTSLELYNIAANLLVDEQNGTAALTPEKLCTRLNELLSAPVSHPYLDQQIQYILGDIIERKIILNDVLSEKLCQKLETTRDQDLIECGYLYNSEKISQMSIEDGAKFLFNAYKDRKSESFLQIRDLLDHDSKGQAILNYLYAQLIAEQLRIDRESIILLYTETLPLSNKGKIQECLFRLVLLYLRNHVLEEKDPSILLSNVESIIRQVLKERPDMQDAVRRNVRQEYWKAFDYSDLDFDGEEYYSQLAVLDNTKCQTVFAAIQLYQTFLEEDIRRFASISAQIFGRGSAILQKSDCSVLVKKILDACVASSKQIGALDLDIWLCASYLLVREGKNPVRFLLENSIRPICMYFESAYAQSTLLQNVSSREKFTQWVTECIQDKADYSKTASEVLKVLRDGEKRMRQERKRQQREEQRDAREATGKNTFVSNITGFFRRKNDDDLDDWS